MPVIVMYDCLVPYNGNYKIISSREGKLQLAKKMFMGKGTSDVITQWFR